STLEWRMVPGDSLALRSGDQVLLPAGAGVRFESGRRVPGAPISGVAWADATASSALDGLLAAAGAAGTLGGGGPKLLSSPWGPRLGWDRRALWWPPRASSSSGPAGVCTLRTSEPIWRSEFPPRRPSCGCHLSRFPERGAGHSRSSRPSRSLDC